MMQNTCFKNYDIKKSLAKGIASKNKKLKAFIKFLENLAKIQQREVLAQQNTINVV